MFLWISSAERKCSTWNIPIARRFPCPSAWGHTGRGQQLSADGTVAIGRPMDVVRGSSYFIFVTGVRNQDKLSFEKVILLHFSFTRVTPWGLENRSGAVCTDGGHTVLSGPAVYSQLMRDCIRLQKIQGKRSQLAAFYLCSPKCKVLLVCSGGWRCATKSAEGE